MNSIERLLEYTKLPQEGKRRVKGAKLKSWPSQGTIEFKVQSILLRRRKL